MGVSSERQSGNRRSSPTGSMTAPERICAPTSEPFSTTTTEIFELICLRRIAAASPDGPAPTTTTSNSIASRAGSSTMSISWFCSLARVWRDGLAEEPARAALGPRLSPCSESAAVVLKLGTKPHTGHHHHGGNNDCQSLWHARSEALLCLQPLMRRGLGRPSARERRLRRDRCLLPLLPGRGARPRQRRANLYPRRRRLGLASHCSAFVEKHGEDAPYPPFMALFGCRALFRCKSAGQVVFWYFGGQLTYDATATRDAVERTQNSRTPILPNAIERQTSQFC